MSPTPPKGTRVMRCYTQAPVDASWLSRVMVPLVRSLRTEHSATVAYLSRGWKHGPHIDLVATGARPLPWAQLESQIAWRAEDLPPPMTDRQYLDQARELGRLERVPPPYLPLNPRGTVEWLTSDPGSAAAPILQNLGDQALTRMSTPIAQALDLGAQQGSAVPLVALVEAFAALGATHPGGMAHGVFSLRSHAEAFLHWAGGVKDVRPAFERRLARDAEILQTVVLQARDGGSSALATEWRSTFGYCMGAFDAAVADGRLSPGTLTAAAPAGGRAGMGPPGATDRVDIGRSEFHSVVAGLTDVKEPPEWFTSFRLLINLFYGQLPLLGVTPIQRFYLCFAVAETVDAVFGETWRERLERMKQRTG